MLMESEDLIGLVQNLYNKYKVEKNASLKDAFYQAATTAYILCLTLAQYNHKMAKKVKIDRGHPLFELTKNVGQVEVLRDKKVRINK